ncbi:HigA family addiction module antitoxin [Bartonella sp. DGB1]|uniref:HigA family addiction module antitoxin n=1 Tax=Bartonella sp. DGB1 TaxID=3239807 RepID=UPI003524DEB2
MMYNPCHPGELLKDSLTELGISVTDAAKQLGISRVALSRVLNCKAGISSDLAIRLELAGLSAAYVWVGMQSNYDLSLAQKKEKPSVLPFIYSNIHSNHNKHNHQ